MLEGDDHQAAAAIRKCDAVVFLRRRRKAKGPPAGSRMRITSAISCSRLIVVVPPSGSGRRHGRDGARPAIGVRRPGSSPYPASRARDQPDEKALFRTFRRADARSGPSSRAQALSSERFVALARSGRFVAQARQGAGGRPPPDRRRRRDCGRQGAAAVEEIGVAGAQ